METIIEFIANNYIWFIVGGIIIILALIGYYADKNHLLKSTKKEVSEPLEIPQEQNIQEPIQPVAIAEAMADDFVEEDLKDAVQEVAENVEEPKINYETIEIPAPEKLVEETKPVDIEASEFAKEVEQEPDQLTPVDFGTNLTNETVPVYENNLKEQEIVYEPLENTGEQTVQTPESVDSSVQTITEPQDFGPVGLNYKVEPELPKVEPIVEQFVEPTVVENNFEKPADNSTLPTMEPDQLTPVDFGTNLTNETAPVYENNLTEQEIDYEPLGNTDEQTVQTPDFTDIFIESEEAEMNTNVDQTNVKTDNDVDTVQVEQLEQVNPEELEPIIETTNNSLLDPEITDEEILSQTKDLDSIREELNKIVFETNLDKKYLKNMNETKEEFSDINIKLPNIDTLRLERNKKDIDNEDFWKF